MRIKILPLAIFLASVASTSYSQTGGSAYAQPQPPLDPMTTIALEVTRVSRSVATLNQTLTQFVDKFEKVGGLTLTEKQQRFVMGLEILVRSEQRVATLQKAQADTVEKQIQVRARLTQIDLEMRPGSIERSTQLQGSVDTLERQENRREKLVGEQRALMALMQSIERNLAEIESSLREAQAHVYRLRRSLLPQIEKEIEGQGN
jgi:RNA polymerase-interacting CarD/CdnL/TRCF family regulator